MDQSENRLIKAVLFDFGGVIADEGFRDGLRAIAIQQGLDPDILHRAGIDAVYESGFVTGRASEADFWCMMRERTDLQGEDDELTKYILSLFVVRPWVLKLIEHLRNLGLITAILSDQTDWLDRLNERDGFMLAFDYVFNSYWLGKGKRDPTLFDDVVNQLSILPEEAVFIDDAPDNIDRARSRGLHTHLYINRKRLEEELAMILNCEKRELSFL